MTPEWDCASLHFSHFRVMHAQYKSFLAFPPRCHDNAHVELYTHFQRGKKKEEHIIVRSWSKGTMPLVFQKEHHAQDESSKQEVSSSLSDIVSSVSCAASCDAASRRFLLPRFQPSLAALI